jgi:transposase-like protein
LSVARFCRTESISESSFYRWRRWLADEAASGAASPSPKPGFVEVGALSGDAAEPAWQVELALGADIVLRIGRR